MGAKTMFVSEEHFHAPCHMPMCNDVINWSIHDLEGRPQIGLMVCDSCLRAIMLAGAKTLGWAITDDSGAVLLENSATLSKEEKSGDDPNNNSGLTDLEKAVEVAKQAKLIEKKANAAKKK